MDHFERQLAQMMRDTEAPTPFEPRHRERLWSGVRARRRRRAAQSAVGSVLAVVGLSVGLTLLPGHATRVEPSHPGPQPATSPSPSASPATPDPSLSAPPSSGTSTAPARPDETTTIMPPGTIETPPASTESTSPPSGTATARN
ncbi:cellulase [Streptomyces sp. NPDC001142]